LEDHLLGAAVSFTASKEHVVYFSFDITEEENFSVMPEKKTSEHIGCKSY